MTLSDYSKSRDGITRIAEPSVYGQLIQESIDVIHALERFFYVGVRIRGKQSMHCPECVIIPKDVEVVEQQLTGKIFIYDYTVELGIAVKHPKDYIAMQEVLGLAEILRSAFSIGAAGAAILIFDAVTGHQNTRVGSTPVVPIDDLGDEVLLFSSGVTVTFTVQTLQS